MKRGCVLLILMLTWLLIVTCPVGRPNAGPAQWAPRQGCRGSCPRSGIQNRHREQAHSYIQAEYIRETRLAVRPPSRASLAPTGGWRHYAAEDTKIRGKKNGRPTIGSAVITS
ncbi:hypothetical protein C9I49_03620 [Pseudomonas prosekii]|uniref:Uncharacterized protein n=1 Tax=Pseudomonas prosekii TaxID=1148509 RepID=A0A2U2DCV7_9PSED|nr:hypothetical protein C9I49_03620 [Pseudomonas prosekii]